MRLPSCVAVLGLALGTTWPSAAQVVDNLSHANALTHYKLGEDLFRDEMFEKAADEFQVAIRFDPLLMMAHYELGQSYMALHRYREAILAYVDGRDAFERIALMIARNDVTASQRRDDEIRQLKETVEELRSQRHASVSRDATVAQLEQRINDLERTKQRGPSAVEPPAELSLALGSAYFRSGDLIAAEREWKTAVSVNRRLGEAHNNLAALYAMTGRKQQAQESLKQAEKSGYRVNPRLKSDIQAMPKEAASGRPAGGNRQ
ncbi:MAG TPA: tetratricopeptide repeat protein [Vicinamibacterales bacterium]|jgi:tetratricopeptide (TPR) repeat protein|nr:tetratricopeptide repeat protein [Vicinamibacterales bacterium]